jgi:hypothetical protein
MKARGWPALNPIVLKELRQAVRSRFITGAYLLFLLLLLVVTGVVVISGAYNLKNDPSALFGSGRGLFHALFAVLSLICMLFMPAYTGLRLAAERGESGLDLQFVTTLTPGAILRGKFQAGMIVTLLLASAALPFLMLTFRLGGVDLPAILLAMGLLLLTTAVTILAANLLAVLPLNRFWRVIVALFGAQALFGAAMGVNGGGVALVESGVSGKLGSADFWQATAMIVVGALLLGGLLLALAIALVSPPAANRALPVRRWATFAWLGWGVTMGVVALIERDADLLLGWMIPFVIFAMAALWVAASERHEFSRRELHEVPRRWWLRALCFPLFSGAAPGTLWAALLGAATLTITVVAGSIFDGKGHGSSLGDEEAFQTMAGLLAYAFAYAQTAILLWRVRLRRRFGSGYIWLIALVLLAAGCLLPLLAGLATGTLATESYGAWTLGNPFALFDDDHRLAGLAFAMIWSGLLLIPQLLWIGDAFRRFKPPAAAVPPPPLAGA